MRIGSGTLQEECTAACGRAACKHVRAHLDARPDWTQAMLQPALSYLGALPIPVLALVTAGRVSLTVHGRAHVVEGQVTNSLDNSADT